jgi:hypothetical protein
MILLPIQKMFGSAIILLDTLFMLEIPVFLQSPINLALLAILGYLVCKELKPSPKIEKARPLVGKSKQLERCF